MIDSLLVAIVAPLFLAGYSWGVYPWISTSVVFPIKCKEGKTFVQENGVVFSCSNATATGYEEIFRVDINLQYASMLGDKTRYFQSVMWSEFTSENMCNKTSLIYQQYSLPYGICSSDGELLVGGTYIPASIAGILTMTLYPVFVFAFIRLMLCDDKNVKKAAWVATLVGTMTLASAAFAMNSWNNFAVPMNYVSVTKLNNVAPIWNASFVNTGITKDNEGQNIPVYSIERSNQIIPSPTLFNSYTAEGYNLWSGTIALIGLYLFSILLALFSMYTSASSDATRPPATTNIAATAQQPASRATAVKYPEIRSNIPMENVNHPAEIRRPSRPAPQNPDDSTANDVVLV
jgi:hypothetical protein